jgi:hypothetical protein
LDGLDEVGQGGVGLVKGLGGRVGGGGALAQALEVAAEAVALFVHDCLQLVYYHL